MDRQIPAAAWSDHDDARRGRLITRFGLSGALFGLAYALFYVGIGHRWGAIIVLSCSASFLCAPFLMRGSQSIRLAGHLLCFTLTCGFTALCCVEGGLTGHAIAWLVSVPLCALLVADRASGCFWAAIAFLAASVIAGLDLAGIRLPLTYDPKWNSLVSAAGYLGLIIFMFVLGLIFENGRARAFSNMQDALAKLAASNERLQHMNNEKNEFLGIAAHDLKNPLAVVMMSAELIHPSTDRSSLTKIGRAISDAATRMHDLITNLLNANAIEQGQFTSELVCCDFRALVDQCLAQNEPAASRKKIGFRVGHSEGVLALADRAAALQILDNLISNAVKYSPPNTTVYIHTLPEKEYAVMTVRDEGPGITEADQKKLFQKFTRLTARPTGGESSTGLGLAIVKRLTEAMRGSIQCHSAAGSGATFTLRLPKWEAAPGAKIIPIPSGSEAASPLLKRPAHN
ncbi:MAG TPA: HAMP domain-containing sensor histidine kinase [Verrucomicrobiae bacterium]|nr:HAMP domain-containing sensor histidine kinase [Verrucomicrobiae bacterium]